MSRIAGADIKAVCTEAGLLALRERRMRVTQVRPASARFDAFSASLSCLLGSLRQASFVLFCVSLFLFVWGSWLVSPEFG